MAVTTLQLLLSRLAAQNGAGLPDPAKPIPLAPLQLPPPPQFMTDPEPEMPPAAPLPALDEGFIGRYAGAAPTAPVQQEPGFIDKLAAILGGVGFGPQYGMALREERERPIREYNAALERYQGRRAQGVELAERRSEREAAQANRANELAYERDFKLWLSKNSDRSDEAKERMRQMFTLQRDANAARLEEERAQRRERRQQERDALHISDQYFGLTRNKTLSDEIGRYRAGLKDSLSPAAAALERRVTRLGEVRMGRAAGIGGRTGASSAAQRAKDNFEAAKQAVIAANQRGDVRSERLARRKLDAAYGQLSRFPGQIQFGMDASGLWPWAQLIGAQQQQPTQGAQPQAQEKTITRAEMQALGITEAEARAEGYTITQ